MRAPPAHLPTCPGLRLRPESGRSTKRLTGLGAAHGRGSGHASSRRPAAPAEGELAVRSGEGACGPGAGGGHLRTGPSREWGAAASPGAWASLPLCRPPCGSGAPLPLVTSPALRPRRRPPSLPAPSRVQGAAWEQRKGGGPSRAVGAAGRRGFSGRRGAGETRRQKAPGLSHCVWCSSERQGPACSPEPARHQGLVTETTLGRAWHLRRERKEVGGCPPPTPHCPPGSSLQKGAPEKCHAPDRTVLGTVVTVTHIPGAVLWSDAQLVGKFTT